ncbi:winged helix-turn-helix transcriptional regulator [Chitinophaga niabensis]|uniref:DNA-binding transcriptional regulator, HxlR family n=1 Tax=Chitinophaga niabensis TaxID=536979 RepID=A0A1N6DY86_9BACT|nr:helix-turn-helix domain-containing protein [Chitinophaga niabensis]SIN75748.1 DNA-binding transcriptional regulator, HxlR family [Chitinophaga niabensis]
MSLITIGPEETCKAKGLAFRDAIDLLSGKWKICILQVLSRGGRRFKDLEEQVWGITPKVLTKELQELEMNFLVMRTVNNTKPVTVSYELTDHAYSTQKVIAALVEFGTAHRKLVKENF